PAPFGRAGDDVVVGQDVALVVDDDAGALRAGAAGAHGERDHARGDRVGHGVPVRGVRAVLDRDGLRGPGGGGGGRGRRRGATAGAVVGGRGDPPRPAGGQRRTEHGDGAQLCEAATAAGAVRGGVLLWRCDGSVSLFHGGLLLSDLHSAPPG